MNVKDSVLYRTLQRQVRKQDHAELLRMLELVPEGAWWSSRVNRLSQAFDWAETPQGFSYWAALGQSIVDAKMRTL